MRMVTIGFVGAVGLGLTVGAIVSACMILLDRASNRKKSARCFLSPSEICHRFHEQGCDYCEDLCCGDNTSPASKLLRAARSLALLCEGGYPEFKGEWKILEDAIHECEGKKPDA